MRVRAAIGPALAWYVRGNTELYSEHLNGRKVAVMKLVKRVPCGDPSEGGMLPGFQAGQDPALPQSLATSAPWRWWPRSGTL